MFTFLDDEMRRFPICPLTKFTLTDAVLVLFLASFSIATHLWLQQHFDYVVSDELQSGNSTNWCTQSRYFFDVHPPLANL
jgi:dolichyl-phosphate-mannose--protein O-mannosyl transferase